MKSLILLLLSPLCSLQYFTIELPVVVTAAKNLHSTRWERGPRVAADQVLTLHVALRSRKSNRQLTEVVEAVTDPVSPLYGQYLSNSKQLQKHFAPSKMSIQKFLQAMHKALVLKVESLNAIQDFWRVSLTASTAEHLFSTKLFLYTHTQRVELSVVRPEGNFSIPQALQDIVTYIDGLESFPTEIQARVMHKGGKEEKEYRVRSRAATPRVIREQYDIPDKITVNYSRSVTHERSATDQGARKMLLIGTFLHEVYNERDLDQFLRTIDDQYQADKMPKAFGPCTSKTDPTNEASLDIQVTSALIGHATGDASDIEMMCYAQLRDPTRTYAADNQEPFLTFLQDMNAMQPPPAVVSISYTDDECSVPIAYAEAVNRELMKAALRGITVLVSSGDAGVQGSHFAEGFCRIPACSKFLSMFPASSPYVTAVGATTIAIGSKRDDNRKWKETVTSTSARALITSGGGFSDLYDMPEYQRKAVTPYLVFANSTGFLSLFRKTGRALPDVSAVGHAFPVVVNGEVSMTDGTSVSAPVLASIVTLLNRAMPELPPLGFLNPLLYRLYETCPHVFADITQGDISCGSKGMKCCQKGHRATSGWDAASGLGTLRFSALLKDLPDCLARMRALNKFAASEELLTMLLGEDSEEEGIDYTMSWTSAQQRITQVLGFIGLIGAISLIGVLVAVRERVFLDPSDSLRVRSRRYGSCAAHDSARECLLPH